MKALIIIAIVAITAIAIHGMCKAGKDQDTPIGLGGGIHHENANEGHDDEEHDE